VPDALLFDSSKLWEFVDVQQNPVELVRLKGSTKRTREPRV